MSFSLVGFFILTLTILVFVHEFGHFWVARCCGVKVLTFSIGFGPVIFRKLDRYDTEWCISALPLGGYVRMLDNRDAEVSKELRGECFAYQPPLVKAAIVVAGPLANFILAFFIFVSVFMFVGKDMTPASILEVNKESPAEVYGLKQNDVLLNIDGNKVESLLDVSKFIMLSTDDFIEFIVLRLSLIHI